MKSNSAAVVLHFLRAIIKLELYYFNKTVSRARRTLWRSRSLILFVAHPIALAGYINVIIIHSSVVLLALG